MSGSKPIKFEHEKLLIAANFALEATQYFKASQLLIVCLEHVLSAVKACHRLLRVRPTAS